MTNEDATRQQAEQENAEGVEQQATQEPVEQSNASEQPTQDNLDAPSVDSLMEEVAELQAKITEQSESVLRAQAEMQNVRRRAERDVENAHKFALDKFSADLLPIIDSLERALDAADSLESDAVKAMKDGMELTLKMFVDALAKHGVEQLNPVGEPFNPEFHQAMSMVPNPDMEPNSVMAVMQKGYVLKGRLVRPAMVIVSKAAG
jgi:molecular chaperone GrpE